MNQGIIIVKLGLIDFIQNDYPCNIIKEEFIDKMLSSIHKIAEIIKHNPSYIDKFLKDSLTGKEVFISHNQCFGARVSAFYLQKYQDKIIDKFIWQSPSVSYEKKAEAGISSIYYPCPVKNNKAITNSSILILHAQNDTCIPVTVPMHFYEKFKDQNSITLCFYPHGHSCKIAFSHHMPNNKKTFWELMDKINDFILGNLSQLTTKNELAVLDAEIIYNKNRSESSLEERIFADALTFYKENSEGIKKIICNSNIENGIEKSKIWNDHYHDIYYAHKYAILLSEDTANFDQESSRLKNKSLITDEMLKKTIEQNFIKFCIFAKYHKVNFEENFNFEKLSNKQDFYNCYRSLALKNKDMIKDIYMSNSELFSDPFFKEFIDKNKSECEKITDNFYKILEERHDHVADMWGEAYALTVKKLTLKDKLINIIRNTINELKNQAEINKVLNNEIFEDQQAYQVVNLMGSENNNNDFIINSANEELS